MTLDQWESFFIGAFVTAMILLSYEFAKWFVDKVFFREPPKTEFKYTNNVPKSMELSRKLLIMMDAAKDVKARDKFHALSTVITAELGCAVVTGELTMIEALKMITNFKSAFIDSVHKTLKDVESGKLEL